MERHTKHHANIGVMVNCGTFIALMEVEFSMQICDFPGATPIGKPRDWVEDLDGECLTIYVQPELDTLTGMVKLHSIYRMSEDEIKALQNGGVLRLSMLCSPQRVVHPVFQMAVLGPNLTGEIAPVPKGGLGDVIER